MASSLAMAAQIDVDNPTFDEPVLDTTFTDVPPNRAKKEGLLSVFYGKPGRAAFYGLIIPAGGQMYNRRYWKVPLALGLEGWAIYNLIDNTRKYHEWNRALIQVNDGLIAGYENVNGAANVKRVRDDFRRGREYGILIVAGAHIFTFMEAFIDRHLTDFDVSDDLTLGYNFGQSSNNLAFGIFYTLQ